jgi:hypothetical protein
VEDTSTLKIVKYSYFILTEIRLTCKLQLDGLDIGLQFCKIFKLLELQLRNIRSNKEQKSTDETAAAMADLSSSVVSKWDQMRSSPEEAKVEHELFVSII